MTAEEMTLRQFVESTWFKGLARLCMVVAVPALLSVGGLLMNVIQDLAGVESAQATAALESGRFQASIINEMQALKDGVKATGEDVVDLSNDLSLVTGILQEMQRRDVARSAFAAPQI